MEHHLSAQLIYPHHVSKWVVLVMARVMAYLTVRVRVIRSFVKPGWWRCLFVFYGVEEKNTLHLTVTRRKSSFLQSNDSTL